MANFVNDVVWREEAVVVLPSRERRAREGDEGQAQGQR